MMEHEYLEPLDADIAELFEVERHRARPSEAIEARVAERLAGTLGWSAGGGGAGGLFAGRGLVFGTLLSVGLAAVTLGLQLHSRGAADAPPATSSFSTVASGPNVPPLPRVTPLQLLSGTAVVDPERHFGRFEGRVVSSETGLPIARAELLFSHDGKAFSTTSADDGHFAFDAPEAGKYELARASAEHYLDFAPPWESSRVELNARPERTLTGVEIQLSPPTECVGVVRDASRAPVAGADVRLVRSDSDRHDRVTTDARGEFRMVLRPGDVIAATHPTLGSAETHVHLFPHRARRVEIELARTAEPARLESPAREARGEGPGVLHGHVLDANGTPVPAFSVVVGARVGIQRELVAQASFFDADGEFEVSGLSPGDYIVSAVADGFAPTAPKMVNVTLGATHVTQDLRLDRGARVLGEVVDADTRVPIAGARVSLEGDFTMGELPIQLVGGTATNGRGQFELKGLASGLRSIMVTDTQHHGRLLSGLEAGANGDVGPIHVELTRTMRGETPRLELTGIGAALKAKDDVLVIDKVLDSGGAKEAGLASGDEILSIDGLKASELGFEQAIQHIRGADDSTVVLRVRKSENGVVEDLCVRRRRVPVR